MAKVIKSYQQANIIPFTVDSFSTVKRGAEAYRLSNFDTDEVSVQDSFFNPGKRATTKILQVDNPTEFKEHIYEEVVEKPVVPASQKPMVEKNAELAKKDGEVAKLASEIDRLRAEVQNLNSRLEEENGKLPEMFAKAKQEGYDKAKAEATKAYTAEKNDYLASLQKFYTDSQAELQKVSAAIEEIDKQLPEIVLGYVKEIIGTERKINDQLVVNVITQALSRLSDLQNIIFTVNPEDAGIVAERFPGHGVNMDDSVPKGAVKIRTRVGEMDLSVDSWMESLQKQLENTNINEKS
jgi:flagellar assembly protein FliH